MMTVSWTAKDGVMDNKGAVMETNDGVLAN
jgi:hypothetical protein